MPLGPPSSWRCTRGCGMHKAARQAQNFGPPPLPTSHGGHSTKGFSWGDSHAFSTDNVPHRTKCIRLPARKADVK
eukprot:1161278-Pelagomonas_calceolata.AAC.8